ncbi:MAG: UPF0280 family protein [Spirochaetales bacterium]|nr:UPF0280 family protein [Spirochaetales bacterium]
MNLREYSYKSASYRLPESCYDRAARAIRELRAELEEYLSRHPSFLGSLVPVEPIEPVPEIARRMHRASQATGLGPMASVAGTLAQMACERCKEAGWEEVLVENGGDLFIDGREDLTLGLYAGERLFKGKLAFRIKKEQMPLAVCSSSGTMGHSLSLGRCDLATVISRDASLADGAATLAGNLVKTAADLEPAVNRILEIEGILGVFLVKGEKIGLGGNLPELVSLNAPDITAKISRDKSERSSFPGSNR